MNINNENIFDTLNLKLINEGTNLVTLKSNELNILILFVIDFKLLDYLPFNN